MQNTNKDGSMVGMDQCRISSIESTGSPLDQPHSGCDGGGTMSSSSSSRAPLLYSQRSRGSHSSSCGGPEDCIPANCATEAEPLLPESCRSSEDSKKGTAHVNKLHFELFDHSQQEDHHEPEVGEVEGVEVDGLDGNKDYLTVEAAEVLAMAQNESAIANGEMKSEKLKGSNDTVCTSSSSTSSSSANASQSLHKSSKAIGKSARNRNKRLRHLSTDTDDTSDISATLEPPDGGWGWVVVAASFLVNLIADGVTFSFGVFFTEFTTYFNKSESVTAWIGSLLAAMPLLSGPIASWLTDRYGCRKVTIAGGLLAALGFVLSSYTTSIYVLMITFGVITGFGLSLCYVAAVVIVAYYFERRRSFATGLSVCGGGIGTFLFAPISQNLIEWYGWQRTTLILAGAFLSLCGCGVLMKDLEWTKKKNKSSNNNNSHSHNHTGNHHGCGTNFPYSANHNQSESDKLNLTRKGNRRCNSAICIPTFVQEQERRERRQRYYSCNQDAGNMEKEGSSSVSGGTVPSTPVKGNLIVMDRSSSPGGGKHKGMKPTRMLNGKEIDKDLYSLSVGPITPPPLARQHDKLPSELVTSSTGHSLPVVKSSTAIPENNGSSSNGSGFISNPININTSPTDLQEHQQQQLVHPELNIIPEEKDTQHANRNNNVGKVNWDTCNGEIDLAHHQTHKLPTSSEVVEDMSGATESSTSCSLLRNLQLNNNNNSNSANPGKNANADNNVSASPDPGSDSFSNHLNHNHHIQTSNNDSNNFSIINNSYNNGLTNGVIRNNTSNNSSNHFLQHNNNNNSVSSFTSTTMPPPPPAPNGIPTIIIPPAQQTKQSVNNAKLDMINSGGRYRSVMHRHSLTYRGAVLNLKRYRLRPASSCPDIISVATSADGRGSFLMNLVGDVVRWIHDVCEWENLVNTRFFLFILSNLLLYTWYDVPYMYLQTAAVRHGYSEDLSSYLISSIGLSNVVGNILLGYMGDKKWASATIVYGVCMIICGATTVLMPYVMEWSYWSLFTVCGLFGLTIAANYALTSVILVQVVSLERFASAYGLLLLVQGIGNLVGPPIAGVISDMTGTNTWSFLVAGIGIFISSFFVLAPIFQRDMEPVSGNQAVEVSNNNTV